MRINECFTAINHQKVKGLAKRGKPVATHKTGAITLTKPSWGDLSTFLIQQDKKEIDVHVLRFKDGEVRWVPH